MSLSSNPGITCTDSVFLIVEWHSKVWVYNSLTLPVEGYLGFSQFWAIMSRAAVNIMNRFLREHKFSFLLCKCLRVQLLRHVVSMYLVFLPKSYF